MKVRRIACLAAAVLLIGLTSGCAMILSRDYLVITPHLDNRMEEIVEDDFRAETFEELKNSILHLIEDGVEEGVIRLYNYAGDAEEDSKEAIRQTMNEEPLGVYAVEYMSYDCVRILSYYEVTISVTYQRTKEQIHSIQKVENAAEFENLLLDAYASYEKALVSLVPWYYKDQYNVTQMLESYYYENPLLAVVPPSNTTKVYPEANPGWQRILEVVFHYNHTPDQLQQMSKDLVTNAMKLLAKVDLPKDNERFAVLAQLLIDHTDPLPDPEPDTQTEPKTTVKDDSFTAYGALVLDAATSEGYAMAYKALCDLTNIECYVVRGRINGTVHYWNLVLTDSDWYHLDALQNDLTESESFLLLSDEQMESAGYKWTAAEYPPTGPALPASVNEEELTEAAISE